MANKYSFILSLLLVLSALLYINACVNTSSEEDVCLYRDNTIGNAESGSCLLSNEDPFNSNPPGSGGKAACIELVRMDGASSITQKVCKSVCDDLQEKCEKAFECDCFDSILLFVLLICIFYLPIQALC